MDLVPADVDQLRSAASGECANDTEDVLADLYEPPAPDADPTDVAYLDHWFRRKPPIASGDERAWEQGHDFGSPVG